ncbi:hypothetical protein N9T42_04220 [SAR86 cluster bacterium]|nr:hypothetical protein [SAR86 cluster bacterium]
MKTFEVTWHLDFWENGVEKITTENIEAENLDNLFDILDEGIEEGEFCPEDEFPEYEKSFNLEYVIIKDEGELVYKDEDFDISKLEE